MEQNNKFSFQITSDKNNNFIITFLSNENLLYVNVGKPNIFPQIIYFSKYTLEKLKENAIFYSSNTIEDTIKEIYNNYKLSKPTLIEEEKKLTLSIPLNHPKEKNLILEMNKVIRDLNESIEDLYFIINDLNKKLNEQIIVNSTLNNIIAKQKIELQNEFNSKIQEKENLILSQNNKLKNLENVIIDQNIKIGEQKKEIEKLTDFINQSPNFELKESSFNNTNYLFQNSKIIKFDKEKEIKIRDWITPNEKINLNLIYQLTRDGKNCIDFHRLCDNKGPTLILIETDRGYKFGGFTSLNWDKSNKEKSDDWTFIFSLNLMEKFSRKFNNKKRSIYCSELLGPCFGNSDFGINQNMNSGWSNANGTFIKNRECTNGESYFNVIELEVFQVIIR